MLMIVVGNVLKMLVEPVSQVLRKPLRGLSHAPSPYVYEYAVEYPEHEESKDAYPDVPHKELPASEHFHRLHDEGRDRRLLPLQDIVQSEACDYRRKIGDQRGQYDRSRSQQEIFLISFCDLQKYAELSAFILFFQKNILQAQKWPISKYFRKRVGIIISNPFDLCQFFIYNRSKILKTKETRDILPGPAVFLSALEGNYSLNGVCRRDDLVVVVKVDEDISVIAHSELFHI